MRRRDSSRLSCGIKNMQLLEGIARRAASRPCVRRKYYQKWQPSECGALIIHWLAEDRPNPFLDRISELSHERVKAEQEHCTAQRTGRTASNFQIVLNSY